jgi:hypothetical protein
MNKDLTSTRTDQNQTAIYITDADAILFVEFQKRYAFIKLLESLNVFDIKSGSVTIHFDAFGQIGSVDKHTYFKI